MLLFQSIQFPNPNCSYIPLGHPSSAHTQSLNRSDYNNKQINPLNKKIKKIGNYSFLSLEASGGIQYNRKFLLLSLIPFNVFMDFQQVLLWVTITTGANCTDIYYKIINKLVFVLVCRCHEQQAILTCILTVFNLSFRHL